MLDQIQHDADRVTRMVTELLDTSRLEAGRLALRAEPVDLAPLAASVAAKVRLEHPDLECTLHFPPDLPPAHADPDKVEQVLTNLVENAVKYGGPQHVRVAGALEGPTLSVAVQDTGEGIPATDLARVFTMFFRRDRAQPSGTGLGLWISKGLVEAQGGELTVESVVGEGSTFRFTLPVDAPAGAEPIGDEHR
jgi:signal transduction histidine kinase